MSWTTRAPQANDGAAATSAAITMPASLASGDMILVFIRWSGADGGYTFTGYTEIDSGFSNATRVFWRIADGTEGASDTITWTTSRQWLWGCMAIRPDSGNLPVVYNSNVGVTEAAGTTHTSGSFDPPDSDTYVVYLQSGNPGAAITWSNWTGGLSERIDRQRGTTFYLAIGAAGGFSGGAQTVSADSSISTTPNSSTIFMFTETAPVVGQPTAKRLGGVPFAAGIRQAFGQGVHQWARRHSGLHVPAYMEAA